MFNKEQLQRFSIRKLTVGAASVLIGVLFLTSWNTNTVYADSINGESIAKNNNPQEGNPAVNKDNVQIVDNDSTEVSNISDSKSSKVIKSDATKSDIVRDKTTIDDNSGTKVPEHTAQANNKQALTTVTEDNGAKVSKTEKYSNSDIKKQPKNSEETQETTLVKKVLDKEKLSSESLIEEKLSSESLINPKKDGKVEIRATDPSNTISATDPSNYPTEKNGLIGEDKHIYQVLSDKYIYQVLSLDGYSRSKLILSVNRNDHEGKNIYAYVIDADGIKQSKKIGMDQYSIITIDGRKYELDNNGSREVFIGGNKVSIQNSSTVTSQPWNLDNNPIGQDYGLGNTSTDKCAAIGEIVPVFTTNSVIKYYYRDNKGHLQEFKNSELPNVSVEGFTGQKFEIDNVAKYKRVIQGYHLISDNIPPKGNFNGTLSQFSDGKYYKKVYYDFYNGEVEYSVLYHQIYPDGTMEVWLLDDNDKPLTGSRAVIAPNKSIKFQLGPNEYTTVRNPYVTAAPHEVQLIYAKNGKIIPVDKNHNPIKGADQPVFPTDPKYPSKVDSVEIPDLSAMGYHPLDKAVKTVDPDSKDPSKDIEVEYVKSSTISVKYHDNTEDKDIDGYGKNASGDEDDPFNYDPATDLATLKGKGYVLDGDLPKIPDKFPDEDKTVIIPLKHGIVTVDTNNPQTPNTPINPNDPQSPKYPKDISNTNSDVKRTIDYKFKDGKTAQPTVNDSLHFERTVVIDKVTGDVLSDIWTPSQDFNDVQTPVIQGYTPDRTVVSDTNIGHDHQNIVEHVIYNPDAQHMTITYVDDTTHETLKQDKLDGTSDQDAKYTTSDSIKHYTDLHYKLVSDSTNGQDLIFDHDDKANQTYEVHFIHGTHTINQTTSPKQTVHYVYADGLARQG
ncbi:mucin-binding protein, partial [Lactobacillus amylovorus]|uniref:mucin-binding protein n=1 Tax=Lactobacillus amylovorus TaxID=1604 RepID=UPI000E4DE2BB